MSQITLSTPQQDSGPSRPYAKLNDIGDSIVIAVGNINKSVPQTHYDTQSPLVWYNRKPTPLVDIPTSDQANLDPVTGTGITGIVVSSNGNTIGRIGGEDVALQPGDEISIYCDGGKNGNQGRYFDAEKNHGPVSLGDILQYRFDRTEPASNPRYNDRKILEFAYRAPKAEELDAYRTKCEDIYRGFQDTPELSTPTTGAQNVAEVFGNEDPF